MARWGLTCSGGNFLVSWVVRRSRGRAPSRTGGGLHLSPRHNDPSLKIAASPILAFFDELRVFDFVEGQNLKVDGGAMVCATSNFP